MGMLEMTLHVSGSAVSTTDRNLPIVAKSSASAIYAWDERRQMPP